MFDRSVFWPPAPDWNNITLEADGLTITATRQNTPSYLLSGDPKAVEALVTAFTQTSPARFLRIAPDRYLFVSPGSTVLQEGWHGEGVAVSAVDGLYVGMEIRGPGAMSLLRSGSMSIAMMKAPLSATALPFAGVTVVFEPMADGALFYVEHPHASYVWQWIEAFVSRKDH